MTAVICYRWLDTSSVFICADCGGYLTAPRGLIQSPRFPLPYAHSLDCRWLVRAPRGHLVRLRVLEFQLEQQYSCLYDFLELWDGRNTLLGRYVRVSGLTQMQFAIEH